MSIKAPWLDSSGLAAAQLAVRSALSAGLAIGIAQFLRLEYPIYALVGAVIVTDLSPQQTRQLGLQRLAGTVLGAALGATFSWFMSPGAASIGFGILVAMFLSHVLHLKGAAKITGYVCGIVMLEHNVQPWSYALYRLIETLLGVAVALLVSFAPKLLTADDPRKKSADESELRM